MHQQLASMQASLQLEREQKHGLEVELQAQLHQMVALQSQIDDAQQVVASKAFVVSSSSRQAAPAVPDAAPVATNTSSWKPSVGCSHVDQLELAANTGGSKPAAAQLSQAEAHLTQELESTNERATLARTAALAVVRRLTDARWRDQLCLAFRAWQVPVLRSGRTAALEDASALEQALEQATQRGARSTEAYINGPVQRRALQQSLRATFCVWQLTVHAQVRCRKSCPTP